MSERDSNYEGRDAYDMDVDRMINEGLGGGMVSYQNGLVQETSVDTMQGESGLSGGSAARQALNDDDESVT